MDSTTAPSTERPVTSRASSLWSRDLALPFEPWAVLWALAVATPWLVPTHMSPWRGFHADFLMALVLLPAGFWAMLRSAEAIAVPRLAVAILGVACVPVMQWAGGMMVFAGDAWIASAYLLGFALAVVTGARLQQVSRRHVIDALFAAFVIAGIVSVGIVLAQWLRLEPLRVADMDLVLRYPGSTYRPFGNLGQPNHLATLLVWSLIALWWAYLSQRIRGAIAVGAAAFLIVGITATQSRTAWLEMAVLLVGAALWRKPLAARRSAPALAALAVLAAALAVGWGIVNQTVELNAARTLTDEVTSPGLRADAWKVFVDAVQRRPWTGWGWNQIPLAQSTVALDHPSLHYTWIKTHNIVLDLVMQNGIPLGLLIAFALAAWMISKGRQADTAASCLLWLAIAALGVHALLEFPQDYAYFLLPAGLMMGMLETLHPWATPVRLNRWMPTGALALVAFLTVWIGVEYRRAESDLTQLRFDRARIGQPRNAPVPDLVVLTQLREFLRALRLRPEPGMSEEQIKLMRLVTQQYPSDGNHLMLAAIEAQNGNPDLAGMTLQRMCRMVPRHRCRDALTAWREMARTSALIAKVDLAPN